MASNAENVSIWWRYHVTWVTLSISEEKLMTLFQTPDAIAKRIIAEVPPQTYVKSPYAALNIMPRKCCTYKQWVCACINSVMILSKCVLICLLLWIIYMITIQVSLQKIICMYHCIQQALAKSVSATLGPTFGISFSAKSTHRIIKKWEHYWMCVRYRISCFDIV